MSATSYARTKLVCVASLGLALATAMALIQRRKRQQQQKPKVVFILGGPGAGKGTICSRIVEDYHWVHLSAGDLLRAERQNPESKNGQLIEHYIKEGKIVPVEITVNLIKKAMFQHVKHGNTVFLVDGFPRNLDNKDGWEKVMGDDVSLESVLFFDCPEATLTARCLNRGQGRADDNLEAIKKRFVTYQNESRPIIDHYAKEGLVTKIETSKPVDAVYAEAKVVIDRIASQNPRQPIPQAI